MGLSLYLLVLNLKVPSAEQFVKPAVLTRRDRQSGSYGTESVELVYQLHRMLVEMSMGV